MKAPRRILVLLSFCALAGCGGGNAGPEPIDVSFEVDYQPAPGPQFPNGVVDVFPTAGHLTLSSKSVTEVDLQLPGQPVLRLVAPNFQPKDNPQLHYVFGVPAGFVTGAFACGAGAPQSAITVVVEGGAFVLKTLDLCPGIATTVTF